MSIANVNTHPGWINRCLPSPAQDFLRYDIWTMGGSGQDIRSTNGIDRVSIYVFALHWAEVVEIREMRYKGRCMKWLTNVRGGGIVMDRDRRLTGWLRGQTDKVEAPMGFEVNNPWKVSSLSGCRGFGGVARLCWYWGGRGGSQIVGEEIFLSKGFIYNSEKALYIQLRQTIKLLVHTWRLEYLASRFLRCLCRSNSSALRFFRFRCYIFRLFPGLWPRLAVWHPR